MTLHRAGWDNKKMADEVDATEKQVYRCIRYQVKKADPGGGPDGKEQEIGD